MKLIDVKLHGYKRFFNKTKIDLKSKEIALIGPNEVGKSSVIQALLHLEKEDEFLSAGVNRELTRNQNISGDQYIVSASYLLSSEDVDAISHIEGGNKVKWFHVHKDAEGYFFYSLEPDLYRDKRLRRDLLGKLGRLQGSRRLKDILNTKTQKYPEEDVNKAISLRGQLVKALNDLKKEVDTLDKAALTNLSQLASSISIYILDTDPSYLQPLPQKIVDLVSFEQTDSPSENAVAILKQRRPKFVLFSDADRDLQHEYGLVIDEEYPVALKNLTQLAGLDLPSLRRAVETGDRGRIATLISRANNQMKEVFSTSWSQSKISVYFDVNGQMLNIMVDNSNEINSIAERSDGLRQYVGLRAFVETQTGEELILLLDEIERHLHYDAQVDLIQMLAKQVLVSKVIYTTHSIGCLPEDLGLGVRMVEPEEGEENLHVNRSKVNNWFWSKDKPGLHPLLSGMGATLLAFFPLRYALFTEGPTDMILLPTVFREVAGKESLGFQIIPGLSIASEEQIAILNNQAARVAYLVDDDDGGESLKEKILSAGIPEEKITSYTSSKTEGFVLEDFIDPELYCIAINNQLSKWNENPNLISIDMLPVNNRPKWLEDFCKEQGFSVPSKRDVAYEILDNSIGKTIITKKYSKFLNSIYTKIESIINSKIDEV